ncbi:MAG: hypothetical protein VYE73_17260, partial [Acidobacteriota bacterium]|nr:hypothetical protein [Acidobacteriota bacterium]
MASPAFAGLSGAGPARVLLAAGIVLIPLQAWPVLQVVGMTLTDICFAVGLVFLARAAPIGELTAILLGSRTRLLALALC